MNTMSFTALRRSLRRSALFAVLMLSVTLFGCATAGGNGALMGGGAGAAAGAVAGSMVGHAGRGAVIGGVLGLFGGWLFGHHVDKNRERVENGEAPVGPPVPPRPGVVIEAPPPPVVYVPAPPPPPVVYVPAPPPVVVRPRYYYR